MTQTISFYIIIDYVIGLDLNGKTRCKSQTYNELFYVQTRIC